MRSSVPRELLREKGAVYSRSSLRLILIFPLHQVWTTLFAHNVVQCRLGRFLHRGGLIVFGEKSNNKLI